VGIEEVIIKLKAYTENTVRNLIFFLSNIK
jgi:hypothetical protein